MIQRWLVVSSTGSDMSSITLGEISRVDTVSEEGSKSKETSDIIPHADEAEVSEIGGEEGILSGSDRSKTCSEVVVMVAPSKGLNSDSDWD